MLLLFWSGKWQPTPVSLPGEFHGQSSLVGYHPWGCKELKMTKRLTHTHTFLFYATTNHFSTGLWRWWKTDFIQWQPEMTSSVFGNEKKLQCTSQSQSCTQKSSWSLFGGCCLSDSLELSESWQNHYIWEVCSADWWAAPTTAMPAASTGQQKGPGSSPRQRQLHATQPTPPKLNELGYKILPHPSYSLDLSPTNYHFFKHLDNFLQGKPFPNQREAENAFEEFVESWGMGFYATGINKHFFWQKCVDCNGSYFDQ